MKLVGLVLLALNISSVHSSKYLGSLMGLVGVGKRSKGVSPTLPTDEKTKSCAELSLDNFEACYNQTVETFREEQILPYTWIFFISETDQDEAGEHVKTLLNFGNHLARFHDYARTEPSLHSKIPEINQQMEKFIAFLEGECKEMKEQLDMYAAKDSKTEEEETIAEALSLFRSSLATQAAALGKIIKTTVLEESGGELIYSSYDAEVPVGTGVTDSMISSEDVGDASEKSVETEQQEEIEGSVVEGVKEQGFPEHSGVEPENNEAKPEDDALLTPETITSPPEPPLIDEPLEPMSAVDTQEPNIEPVEAVKSPVAEPSPPRKKSPAPVTPPPAKPANRSSRPAAGSKPSPKPSPARRSANRYSGTTGIPFSTKKRDLQIVEAQKNLKKAQEQLGQGVSRLNSLRSKK